MQAFLITKYEFYRQKDCLQGANLTQEQIYSMINNQIKIVPMLQVTTECPIYVLIIMDNFKPNATNPEFRDNIIEFDIICHFDQWHMKDFALRPYKIAAELDTMFDEQRLTGIGKLEFLGANQMILTDEYAGLCVMYKAIHGEEDKKGTLNPKDEKELKNNFDAMFND